MGCGIDAQGGSAEPADRREKCSRGPQSTGGTAGRSTTAPAAGGAAGQSTPRPRRAGQAGQSTNRSRDRRDNWTEHHRSRDRRDNRTEHHRACDRRTAGTEHHRACDGRNEQWRCSHGGHRRNGGNDQTNRVIGRCARWLGWLSVKTFGPWLWQAWSARIVMLRDGEGARAQARHLSQPSSL